MEDAARARSASTVLLEEYLATLPRGADSYPECRAKGSLVRAYLLSKPVRVPPSMPDVIRNVVERPVLAASWIPEVAFLGVALLVREQWFDDDDAFLAWVKELNAQLFRSPLYRVLMFVASTRLLISGTERRWRTFHTGTELVAQHGEGPYAELELRYPLRFFAPLHVRLFAVACSAALEAAGAEGCRVESLEVRTHIGRARLVWGGS